MRIRKPSPEAAALHLLLASIVTAGLTGCAGATLDPTPGDADGVPQPNIPEAPTPGDADEVPQPDSPDAPNEVALQCRDGVPSRVRGLNAAYAYDSLALYTDGTEHATHPPDFTLVEAAGEPCASSPDQAACLDEVEFARSSSASWWHYDNYFSSSWTLLLATHAQGANPDALNREEQAWYAQPGRGTYVSRPIGGESTLSADQPLPVVTIDYTDELLEFLGRIDTPNEAALVMFAHGRPIRCEMKRDGEDFIASGTWQISDCPITSQQYELRVSSEGDFSETELGEPEESGGCVGRRPDGLRGVRCAGTADAVAAWLAHTAHLEAAAVAAFALMEAELRAHAAPESLLRRVRRAAQEEMQHAERVGHLARTRGAEPPPVMVQRRGVRTVLEIALENAVEGCVRECWGALCAHYQARTAQSADVRAVWSSIADEETEHAQLSRDVASWLEAGLTAAERRQVETARVSAISALRRELDRDLAPGLSQQLGLPERRAALQQFDELVSRVLTPSAIA